MGRDSLVMLGLRVVATLLCLGSGGSSGSLLALDLGLGRKRRVDLFSSIVGSADIILVIAEEIVVILILSSSMLEGPDLTPLMGSTSASGSTSGMPSSKVRTRTS